MLMQIATTSAVAASAAEAQDTATLLAQSTIYSTTVGGKSYSADVSLSSGQYVATVPELPGVSATGSTLLSAENNLNARIDVVV
jgi:hypothetical protein